MLRELKVNNTIKTKKIKENSSQNELPKPSSGKISPKSLSLHKTYQTEYNGNVIEKMSLKDFKDKLKNARSKITTPRFTQTSKFNHKNSNKISQDTSSKLDTNAYTSPYLTEFSNVDKYMKTNQNDSSNNFINHNNQSKSFSGINPNLKHHYSTKIKDFQDEYRKMLIKLTDLKAKHYKLEAEKLIFNSSIVEQKAKLAERSEYFKKQLIEFNQLKDDNDDLEVEYNHLVEIKDSTSIAASNVYCQASIPAENKIVDINDNKVLLNDLNVLQEKNRVIEKYNKDLVDELRKLEIHYNNILLTKKNEPLEIVEKVNRLNNQLDKDLH
jgi:hypothetical protein